MTEMSPVERIFFAALEKTTPEVRSAYLDVACGDDADLRQRVERLLTAHPQVGSFLAPPAVDPSADPLAATAAHVPSPDNGLSAEPASAAIGNVLAGRYKLLQQIGEGGMGTVFMAEQSSPVKRMVAVKIIKAGMDTAQVIARFEAERQALAMMDHPSIAKVLDAGATETGRPFFVMELVKGVPITGFCDQNQLTPRERLELFVPVCQAIQHAHMKGIIHRDIKPSNVLIALYDGKPVPKVIDFGVAKAAGQKLTERTMFTAFGALVGTLEYMSPEQAELNQLDIDTRSDIYSLGVLLYELLTGTTPLTRQRIKDAAYSEILRLIREEEPPKPSTRLSESKDSLASLSAQRKTEPARLAKLVRGELDWIVMKALDKDRSRRYETANGLARDIEHHLNDEAVEACPPSAGYRLRKFARKHKTALIATTAFALLLLAGAIVSTWQAVRATRAESEAQEQRNTALAAEQDANRQRDYASEAEKKAQDEARKARAQAQMAVAYKTFIRDDLLGQAAFFADKLPRDAKWSVLLDRAADRLKLHPADQPLVEASIRTTIGSAYYGLGMYQEALPQLERACELFRRELVATAPFDKDEYTRQKEYTPTLWTLASLHDAQGQFEKARPIWQLVRERMQRSPGAVGAQEKQELMEVVTNTTNIVRVSHGDPEIDVGHMASLKFFQDLPEEFEGQFLKALLFLAEGKYAAVETILRRSLKDWRPSNPPTSNDEDDVEEIKTMLGAAMLHQAKYDEARKLLEPLLESLRERCGDEHPKVAFLQQQVGYAYLMQKDFAKAEELLRPCLKTLARQTPDHFLRFDAESLLGAAIAGQQKYAEAEPLLLSGYEGLKARTKQMRAPEMIRLTESVERLVKFHEATGNREKADAWRKKAPLELLPRPGQVEPK
jgi:tetratricopeptide (TPR) repeat protein